MTLSVMYSRLNCHAVLRSVVPPCYSAGIRYFRLPYNDLAVQGDFVLFQSVGCVVGSRLGSGILGAVA
jgi:hypothetical protein